MADKLNLALIQSHLHWEDPGANRKMFAEKMDAMPENVDMIILPEMFTSGFTMNPEHLDASEGIKTVEWMQFQAKKKDAAIVGSIVFQQDDKFFNRMWFVKPDGGLSNYDKRHTFTLAGEDKVYEKGEHKLIEHFRGFSFYPLICYDLRFPVWARNVDGYDVLIYVANWPKPRIAAWDALLKARAIENMAYSVGVNRIGSDALDYEYPGHSGVYDTLGKQLAFSKKEEILYATLSKEHITTTRKKLRFLEDRDEFSMK